MYWVLFLLALLKLVNPNFSNYRSQIIFLDLFRNVNGNELHLSESEVAIKLIRIPSYPVAVFTPGVSNCSKTMLDCRYIHLGHQTILSVGPSTFTFRNWHTLSLNSLIYTVKSRVSIERSRTIAPNFCEAEVEEIYGVDTKKPTVIVQNVQLCSPDQIVYPYALRYPQRRRLNFHNATISILAYDTEGITDTVDAMGIIRGPRAAESILRDFQFMSNFRVKLHMVINADSTKTGYFSQGIGKALTSGEVDLGLGYFFVTLIRVNIASPLVPFWTDKIVAHFIQPKSSWVRNIFVQPLNLEVLLVYLITVTATCTLILYIIKGWDGKGKPTIQQYASNMLNHVAETLVLTTSVISQKGYKYNKSECCGRRKVSSFKLFRIRVLILSTSLLSVLVYSFYSSKLLQVMLSPTVAAKSMDDLIKYDFTFNIKPSILDIVNDPKKPIKHLTNAAVDAGEVSAGGNVLVGVELNSVNGQLLQNYRKMFNGSVKNVDVHICNTFSSIRITSNVVLGSSFYLKKNSGLRSCFNMNLLKVMEAGLAKRYLQYTVPDNINCLAKAKNYAEDLGLGDVSSAFIFLLTFFILTLLVLTFEKWIDKKYKDWRHPLIYWRN